MNNDLISIIMPVYNTELFVVDAIESIRNQTYQNWELIIIDDSSTDNSLKVMKCIKDDRIKIFKNNVNMGISYSLNKGLQIANGKYVARMDSDDISKPDRLYQQYMFLCTHPEVDVLGTDINLVNINGNIIKHYRYNENDNEIKTDLFFGKTPLAHPTIMFRKEIVKRVELKYDSKMDYAEDYDLYCRYSNNLTYANLVEPLLDYRQHRESVSFSHQEMQRICARNSLRNHLFRLGLNFNEQEFQAHCSFYLPLPTDNVNFKLLSIWLDHILIFNRQNKLFNETYFLKKIIEWKEIAKKDKCEKQ